MSFNPYNDPLNYISYNFANIRFMSSFRNNMKKEDANKSIIKNVIGNHYLIQKFMLIHYVSNIFTPNSTLYTNLKRAVKLINGGKLYDQIEKNLKDYQELYMEKMGIKEDELQNIQYRLLVDILGETFDNYVEFLIKQKSKQLAYNLFESYKSRDPVSNKIDILFLEYFPIIKNDKQFEMLFSLEVFTEGVIKNILV
jgi:hypothetical protein